MKSKQSLWQTATSKSENGTDTTNNIPRFRRHGTLDKAGQCNASLSGALKDTMILQTHGDAVGQPRVQGYQELPKDSGTNCRSRLADLQSRLEAKDKFVAKLQAASLNQCRMNEGKILRLQNSYYMKLQSVRQAHQDRLALEKLQLEKHWQACLDAKETAWKGKVTAMQERHGREVQKLQEEARLRLPRICNAVSADIPQQSESPGSVQSAISLAAKNPLQSLLPRKTSLEPQSSPESAKSGQRGDPATQQGMMEQAFPGSSQPKEPPIVGNVPDLGSKVQALETLVQQLRHTVLLGCVERRALQDKLAEKPTLGDQGVMPP